MGPVVGNIPAGSVPAWATLFVRKDHKTPWVFSPLNYKIAFNERVMEMSIAFLDSSYTK